MPQKIYLIRHGQTDYNVARRTQGWLDIPLNEVGREQAKLTASKLVGVAIDHIYSSDLRRAHETAQYVSRVVKKDVITTLQLRERDMGIFSGWRWEHERDTVKDQLWPEFEHSRDIEDLNWNGHNGESLHQMSERITTFMDSLHSQHSNKSVVVVSHGGTINRLLEIYKFKKAKDGFKMIGNASILVMTKAETSYTLSEI